MGVGAQLDYQNLNFETSQAFSSLSASNMYKFPRSRVSPHEGPLLTFTRTHRCMNQCWGLQLPICTDPLIPGLRRLFEMCHRTARCFGDSPTGKARGRHACAFRDGEEYSVIEEASLFCHFMMTCWQVQLGGALICTWSSLDTTTRGANTLITEYPSSACSSDTPFDHWHLTATQTKVLSRTRVCLVKIRVPNP